MENELLNEVIESSNFLYPYIKQFYSNFKDSPSIKEIGKKTDKYINYLDELGACISNKDNDGVVVINTNDYEERLEELFTEIDESLKEEGYLFLVIKNKGTLKERIEYHLLDKYNLVQEYIGDENWNFVLYQKSTIK